VETKISPGSVTTKTQNMFALCAFAVLLRVGVAVDVGYEGMYQSNADAVLPGKQRCFDMPGLPLSLRGTYIIGGPAVFEYGGEAFQSVLDGFGKINRIEIHNGQACYAANMLQSSFWNSSVEVGHVGPGGLFSETTPARTCPWYNPACNLKGGGDNNYVNSVRLPGDGHKIMLLTDTTNLMEYDMSSMTVSGSRKFDDHMTKMLHAFQLGSAHPHSDGHGGFIEFGVESGRTNYVDIYHVDPSAPSVRKLLARYSAESSPYMHSFGMTANYAVLPHNIGFDLLGLLKSGGIISRALEAKFDGVNVVKLDNPGPSAFSNVTKFNPKPFYHVHVVNTFENATGVVFDVSTFEDVPFTGPTMDIKAAMNKTKRDASSARGVIKRYHFALAGDQKGAATEEVLSLPTRTADFPRINENFAGKPYCIYYADEWFHDDTAYASMAVLKHNICTGERAYWFREDWYPSEAIFVPKGEDEADGVLLFLAFNGRKQTSHFIVADAMNMQTLAEAELPLRIPVTAHGQFFQDLFSARAEVANWSKASIFV